MGIFSRMFPALRAEPNDLLAVAATVVSGCGLLVVTIIALSGCGGESPMSPVDSEIFSITINSMNPSDIRTVGIIEKDENVSTGTGNPWGEFIKVAGDKCRGDPLGFDVLNASIALDVAGSQNVSGLEDVISGQVTVYFASTQGSDATAIRVYVASAASPSGTGPVTLSVTSSRVQFDVLLDRLLGGDFHVGLRAETDRTEDDSFSMDVVVTLQVRAHCSWIGL